MVEMECSECGADLRMGQKFCGDCGIEIEWPEIPNTSIGKREPCEHINVDILNNREFCRDCSSHIDTAPVAQEANLIVGKLSDSFMSKKATSRFSPKQRVAIGFGLFGLLIASFISSIQNGDNSSDGSTLTSDGQRVMTTSTSNIDGLVMTDVPGDFTGFSCTDTQMVNSVTCQLVISVRNDGNAVVHLFGDIFAVVNGRIFKATTRYGGIDYVSTDINPGERQSATISFDVPTGSIISDVFIGDNAFDGLSGAKVSFVLNRVASA